MIISDWDLMKLAQSFDGEFSPSDFSPEEIAVLLGSEDREPTAEEICEKYFEYYDDVKDRVLKKHKWSD